MKFDEITVTEMKKKTLLNLFDKNWHKQNGEIQKLGLDDKTIDEFYSESQEMLTGWLKRYLENRYSRPKNIFLPTSIKMNQFFDLI